ncbi:hypothetical protein MRB53_037190 [Persea americana]|nr:hypothetical protein MRB53_037190 [Persea americana]
MAARNGSFCRDVKLRHLEDDRTVHQEAANRNTQYTLPPEKVNANPKLATQRDDDDRTPLHWATSYNHLSIVELLVQTKNFDPDTKALASTKPVRSLPGSIRVWLRCLDNAGQTALHFCASKTNLDAARKLIARKASARVRDRRGQYALHRAAAIGSIPIVQLLLDTQSPLNATDDAGFTALHHEGHGDAALVLLRAGAETDNKTVDGDLAISLAPDATVRSFIVNSAAREGIDL